MTLDEGMREFIREEQEYLWIDLDRALRDAINGVWSIEAASVAHRIVSAARLVGPTPYGEAPWRLVAGGVYEAVLGAADITPDLPADDEWQRLDTLMSQHGGTRASIRPRMAGTVAAINTDRERNWIATGVE